MNTTTPRTNTVQTVLSDTAVNQLECILHWFWDAFDSGCLTKNLMQMLSVYIRAAPDNVHPMQKPDRMTLQVSEILQLSELLITIQEMERPWTWIDTPNGFELPVKEPESV